MHIHSPSKEENHQSNLCSTHRFSLGGAIRRKKWRSLSGFSVQRTNERDRHCNTKLFVGSHFLNHRCAAFSSCRFNFNSRSRRKDSCIEISICCSNRMLLSWSHSVTTKRLDSSEANWVNCRFVSRMLLLSDHKDVLVSGSGDGTLRFWKYLHSVEPLFLTTLDHQLQTRRGTLRVQETGMG